MDVVGRLLSLLHTSGDSQGDNWGLIKDAKNYTDCMTQFSAQIHGVRSVSIKSLLDRSREDRHTASKDK